LAGAFEVIGVLEKQGSFLDGGSLDNQAIIPLKQFVTVFWSNPDYEIQVKVKSIEHWTTPRKNCASPCAEFDAWRRINRMISRSTSRISSSKCSIALPEQSPQSACSSPVCRSSLVALAS